MEYSKKRLSQEEATWIAERFNQAEDLREEGKFGEAIILYDQILEKYPDDWEVVYQKGLALQDSGQVTKGIEFIKQAADQGFVLAQATAAYMYISGEAGQVHPVEAKHYVQMAEEHMEEDEDIFNMVHYTYGLLYQNGTGVKRDIPKAYWHLSQITSHNEMSLNAMNAIKEKYPLGNDGEIDLKQRGRSKWATFFLIAGIITLGSFVVLSYNMGENLLGESMMSAVIMSALACIICLAILCWVPYSLGALMAYGAVSAVYFVGGAVSGAISSVDASEFDATWMISMLIMQGSILVSLSFLKRRKGKAHPMYSMFNVRDDGGSPIARVFGPLLEYGEGEAYRDGSTESRNYGFFVIGLLIVVGLLSLYAAWNVAQLKISSGVEWNIFNNTSLWFALSVIGFFLQFFSWQHTSFERGVVVEEYNGKKKFYKSNDMMDTIEGSFLMPLINHIFLIPALYGALIYYAIMIGFAMLQSVFPYLLALLVVASLWFVFNFMTKCILRRFRYTLCIFIGVLAALVYFTLAIMCLPEESEPAKMVHIEQPATTEAVVVEEVEQKAEENKIELTEEIVPEEEEVVIEEITTDLDTEVPTFTKRIRITATSVNLRQGPDADTPRMFGTKSGDDYTSCFWATQLPKGSTAQAVHLDSAEVYVTSETDEWYQIYCPERIGNPAQPYIMKKFAEEIEMPE